MLAQKHPRQQERLERLHAYGILDTPREADFDDVVRLASQICGMPMSLISLVDEDRQWFKAEVGMGVEQTDLERSICSHVIVSDDFVEIEDTTADQRTRDNPLVTGAPGLRFYAGAKLETADGLPLGTLCVLSPEPGRLSPFQREALGILAQQVMTQLDLRRALRVQDVLRKEMDHRVKNSLATVASIVRLYRRGISDTESLIAFDAIERRLAAISALHEALHRSSEADEVDLAAFMGQVAGQLAEGAPDHVTVATDFAPLQVTSEIATAIAVVGSEFVANSIKHAFPNQRRGRIELKIGREDGRTILSCQDDGLGTAVTQTAGRSASLGQRIMHAAAEHVGARIVTEADSFGYRLRLEI